MQRYTDYDRELQDAVRQLSAVAAASASEKKHDATMATIASNAATTVHEVLERSARRARLYGWITGGVSLAIALVAVVVASSIARGARDMKQSYDRALTRATSESTALHAQLSNSKIEWESMQVNRKEDRSILSTTLEKLTHTYDRLVASTTSLAAAQLQVLDQQQNARVTPSAINSKKPSPVHLAKTQDTILQNSRVNKPSVRKTIPAKRITTVQSSASRRLIDAMRAQRREARGQVEGLFDVYSNKSGSCVTSR